MIKHPVSLKGLQKTVRGVKGREAPTGQTLLKSWDAFASEVSYIWQNAREYNEDGSEISALAGELEVSIYVSAGRGDALINFLDLFQESPC